MPKFCLTVTLGYGCERQTQEELNKLTTKEDEESAKAGGGISGFFARTKANTRNNKIFVASASHVELSLKQKSPPCSQPSRLIAIFVPPSMIEQCIEQLFSQREHHATGSCFWISETTAKKLNHDLLSNIHLSLLSTSTTNNNNNTTRIRGIIRTSILAKDNAPADILLLEVYNHAQMEGILARTNGQHIIGYSNAILKVLPIETIEFLSDIGFTKQASSSSKLTASSTAQKEALSLQIPACPVCLYRIDPVRLGLPSSKEICSKFCPSPDFFNSVSMCPNQRFLVPWPLPSRCRACQVIQDYWKYPNDNNGQGDGVEETKTSHQHNDDADADDLLFCEECAMHKTLWVCLTCSFVGCGRYSNKHSVEHFQQTSHPFALELATLRIWDYVHGQFGGYAHRVDLLECPSSPVTPLARSNGNGFAAPAAFTTSATTSRASLASHEVPTRNQKATTAPVPNYHSTHSNVAHGMYDNDEKSPKKATMIGEEYEALLQSALEDQAQHFEGEITRLHAQLTSPFLNEESLSSKEQEEIQVLRSEIDMLQGDIDVSSRELLDTQEIETVLRARSQKLLRQCQDLREEVNEIEKQTKQENEWGRLQIEDLEQQVGDLTANLRMRHQFSQNEELNRAQIFGTSEQQQHPQNRKGKKGRFFRR